MEPSTSGPLDMQFNITNWVNNVKVLVPLIELAKFPSINTKLKEWISIEKIDTNEDFPVILQAMTQEGKRNGSHHPFFISLMVNDLLLHNCMLDSRSIH
jgi:hypothetical protein